MDFRKPGKGAIAQVQDRHVEALGVGVEGEETEGKNGRVQVVGLND